MTDTAERLDWDPAAEAVQRDQVAAYDALRQRCPVVHSQSQGWSLLRHHDVLAALLNPETFSSRVSVHVAVPNGMDPPEHGAFRAVVDRAFTPGLGAAFEPRLRRVATDLLAEALDDGDEVEVMAAIGEPFAARAQCAYLGWPAAVVGSLQAWAADSAHATRARDRAQLDRVAARFDAIILGILDITRAQGPQAPDTLTARLLAEEVDGRPLTDAQLVSMLRNWTAGELGTIAAAVGIIAAFLADQPELQQLLRDQPDLRQRAMDEMLRIEAPLIANRRRTTRPVSVGGQAIPAGQPVTLLWPAAQRDPEVFADPTEFRLDRDPGDNLLYGRGPHYCPGEGLARLELGVLLDELLRAVPAFRRPAGTQPVRATYPAGGFSEVRITWSPSGA